MTPTSLLADRVAATDPRQLLPLRLSHEGSNVPGRLELIHAHPLDGHVNVLLLAAGDARYVAPVVDHGALLRRAVAGDGAAEALLATFADDRPAVPPSCLTWQRFAAVRDVRGERAMKTDQTHESLVVGERAVVKWMVQTESSPAPTLVAHLAANDFLAMPQPWGFLSWSGPAPGAGASSGAPTTSGESLVLASVAEFLPGAVDGWEWCVADVESYCDGDSTLLEASLPAQHLGRLLAEFHDAASTRSHLLDEPVLRADQSVLNGWLARAVALCQQALEGVEGSAGERLRARRDRVVHVLGMLAHVDDTPVMPIHGDLHVGQILRWDGGYAINDFDGNPVLPAGERGAPQSPARDVAGMVQSLDHVARVVERRADGADPTRVSEWLVTAQRTFVDAYSSGMLAAGKGQLFDDRLLMPFRVEQELREFVYAAEHLPRWGYVPDAAMSELLP